MRKSAKAYGTIVHKLELGGEEETAGRQLIAGNEQEVRQAMTDESAE